MQTHRRHRPHKCSQCPAAFQVKSYLKDHLKVHSDERPFMCEVCGKAFKYASVLDSHLTIHTREGKYKCDVCGKLYRYRASLSIHMNTHMGKRPHKCGNCPASFYVKSHLTDHHRIHSGEKPFKCEICSACFSRTFGLQKHLRTHIRRGEEVDVDAVMLRAKLRARIQLKSSRNDQPESRSSHCTDKAESKGTEENTVLYTEPIPDDDIDVVLTLCSIGDGSICSYSTEKQEAENRLRAQVVMKERILTAKKKITHGHDQELTQHDFSYSKKEYVEDRGNGKHPIPPNEPISSSKCMSTKPATTGQSSMNKTHKEADNVDKKASCHVTTRNRNQIQTRASVRSVVGSGDIRADRGKSKSSHTSISQKEVLRVSAKSRRSQHTSQTEGSGDFSADKEKSKPLRTSIAKKEVLKNPFRTPHQQDHSFRRKEGDAVSRSSDENLCLPPKYCQALQCKEPSEKLQQHLNAPTSPLEMQTHPTLTQAGQDDPHTCPVCGKNFSKRCLLKVHHRRHTGEKPFVCKQCNKRFISATHRRVHKRLHISEQPLQCPYCRKPHRRRRHFQKHLRVCHSEAEKEEEGSNIPLSLTLSVTPENGALVCSVQEESYQDSECDSLRNSLSGQPTQTASASSEVTDYHNHPYEHEAAYDTVLEIEESDLSQDVRLHNSTENTRETRETDARNHQESWLKDSNDKIQTDMTNKASQTRSKKMLKCRYCPKTFRYKSAVTSHERSHTGEQPFQCSECGKGFSKKSNMNTHARTHTGERPFLCDLCGKHFSHRYTLEAHRWQHTEEKPFQCGICGKGFRHETNRQVHLKRHAGEKNFKCDFCPKAFITKTDLQDHRRVHTKERPYRCEECGRRFAVRHHLSDHRRLHSGDRPHKCRYCNMAFVRARSWRLHEQKHSHLMRESFQETV